MTSISTSLASYYQLFGQSSGSSSSSLTGSSSSSSVTSLAQVLDSLDSSDSSSDSSSAFSLNLSQQAQDILSGNSSSSSTGSSSSDSSFTLTAAQKTTINNILAKYKNAPYTQATFDSIQSDLSAAGLSPQQLSAKDEIQSFNPTDVLMNALSGNSSSTSINTPSTTLSNEQTKANNYIQSIISDWQSISTTAAATTSGTSSSTSVSA